MSFSQCSLRNLHLLGVCLFVSFERNRQANIESKLLWAGSLPKCQQWVVPELAAGYSIQISHVGGRDLSTGVIICCRPGSALAGGCSQEWEMGLKPMYTYIGHGHLNQEQANSLLLYRTFYQYFNIFVKVFLVCFKKLCIPFFWEGIYILIHNP